MTTDGRRRNLTAPRPGGGGWREGATARCPPAPSLRERRRRGVSHPANNAPHLAAAAPTCVIASTERREDLSERMRRKRGAEWQHETIASSDGYCTEGARAGERRFKTPPPHSEREVRTARRQPPPLAKPQCLNAPRRL